MWDPSKGPGVGEGGLPAVGCRVKGEVCHYCEAKLSISDCEYAARGILKSLPEQRGGSRSTNVSTLMLRRHVTVLCDT